MNVFCYFVEMVYLLYGGVDYYFSEVFYLVDLDGNGIEIYYD